VGNFISKMKFEEWRSHFFSRPVDKNYWTGIPMARPAARNYWAGYPTPRFSGAGSAKARRADRVRRNAIVLFGGAFILILCALIITCLVLIFQSFSQPTDTLPSVTAQKTSQSSVSYAQAPAGQIKILLLGSDQRPNDNGYRTDVIILLVIDPGQMTVSIVSFPRDLWVKVPSLYEMKINQVQALGGFDATAEMFQANFGVKPDYYVLTNFNGFTSFFDNQGGVDVEVSQALADECSLPKPRDADGNCTVEPGTVHMDGATALWYVRSRHSSSDFDRLRRAQEVLTAIFKKLVNVNSLTKLGEIKAALDNNIETNLSIDKAVSFLPVAVHVLQYPDQIRRFAIGEEQATPSWSWNGMWILLPDPGAIQKVLREAGIKK